MHALESWEDWEDALDEKAQSRKTPEYHDDPESILLLLLAHEVVSDAFLGLEKRALRQVNRLLYRSVNDSLTTLGPWEPPSDNDESSSWAFPTKGKFKAKAVVKDKDAFTSPTHLPLSLIAKCPKVTQLSIMDMDFFFSLDGIPSSIESLWMCRSNVSNLAPLSSCTRLKNLDISCTEVLDLAGLEGCIALADLDCHCSRIFDIAALASCQALMSLDISHTFVSDLSPLSKLPSLTKLRASDCEELSDLSPLTKLTTLTELVLSDCHEAYGLQSLSNLTGLKELGLNGFLFQDDDSLPFLPSLSFLDASHSNIPSLSPFSALKSLEKLELRNCVEIFDLEPLSHCKCLTELDLSDVHQALGLQSLRTLTRLNELILNDFQLQDDDSLPLLPSLVYLDASYSNLPSLSPLSQCLLLEKLDLRNCDDIFDLHPLSNCTRLLDLDLSSTCVEDLSDLGGCTLIEILTLPETCHEGLSVLSQMVNLHSLTISGCQGVIALPPLPNLTSLNCSQSGIRALLPVPKLNWADISNTFIEQLDFLEGCTDLYSLSMSNTPVKDLSPLSSCSNLESLNCSNTNIKDLAPLAACTSLFSINARNTEISSIKCLENLPNLSSMELELNKLQKEVIKSWADGKKGRFGR